MATYTPLPFAPKPFDQSQQQLRLVDLMYQAQLSRIQKEQEARLQGAQMWTNLGLQLPQIVSNVEENRIRRMQADADLIRANAYEQYMRDQAEMEQERLLLGQQKAAYESVPGGADISMDTLQLLGPYGAGFAQTPVQESVSERGVTPADTMTLSELSTTLPSREFGTLPSRPMGLSVLPGMATETPTEFGGFATKPKSAAQLKAEEESAKAAEAQASLERFRNELPPAQRRQFDIAQATRGINLPGEVLQSMMGVPAPATRPTMGQLEAEEYEKWKAQNPDKTFIDYERMKANAVRATREERSDGLTPNQQFSAVDRLNNDWRKDTDDVAVLANQYGAMRDAYQNLIDPANKENREIRNVATQIIINGLNKMLDPTSVVREGEYARSEQGVAFLNKAEGWLNRLTRGGPALTDGELREFVNQSERLLNQRELVAGLDRKRQSYLKRAEYFKLPAELLDLTNPAEAVRGAAPTSSSGYGVRKP